ncbi:vascular cell adhesion protein 1 isoform X1 [Silurus meridionalis]|nr:vascular cell adhesion protein 1 isoform X1 [Silurus meridionalis]
MRPKKPLFRVGDTQELTCHIKQCPENITLTWSSLEDKPLYVQTKTSFKASILVFKDITKNMENTIQCNGRCHGVYKQAMAKVRVYSFPNDPVISGHNSLVLSKENTLTCEVSAVFPAEYMTVEWLMGGKVVHTEEGEYGTESVQSTYRFTPQINDDKEAIMCRATLSLEGLPVEERTRETTVSMAVLCPTVNTQISVSPNDPKEMDAMTVSCVSDSSLPSRLVLSKVLNGMETVLASGNRSEIIVSYDKATYSHSAVYVCTTTTDCGSQTSNITVTVGTHPLEVSLEPDMSIISVEQGSSMMLSCNSSGCPHAQIIWKNVTHQPHLSWNDSLAFGSQLGPWTVDVEDNRTFICEVKCGSVVKSKLTQMKVFSFPSDPTIESSGPFLEGKVTNLTCTVRDIFPADHFHIQWLDGDVELHSRHGNFSDKLQNLILTLPFKPEYSNQKKTLTCKVSLKMDKKSSQKTASTTLEVHYPPKHTSIAVRPQKKVNEGETVTIVCSTESVPEGDVILKRVWNGEETTLVSSKGTQAFFNISSTSVSDSGIYVCEAVNKYGNQSENVQITVQAHPLEVSLEPDMSIISVEHGSSMMLSCNSSGCPHAQIIWKNLTHKPSLSWNDSLAFGSQLGPWTVDVEDNRSFICEVKCGSVVKSKLTQMKVFSFPSDPTIESSGPFLEGKVTNLTCTVRDIFPADHFHIQWLDGDVELHSMRGNFSDKLQNLILTLPFKPQYSNQKKTLTCKVSLKMDKKSSQKTASTTLEVHYPPKHTSIAVRPQKKVNEGETVTIVCSTESVPEGDVILKRVWNGEETTLVSSKGTQAFFNISSTSVSDSGIYVCEAVNKYGNQSENVQITVQAPPRNIVVTVYPSKVVQEGDSVTICGQSLSFPPSDITLRKLNNGSDIYSSNGTFLLVNLTSNDSGQYQVKATNALGSDTEIFTINVLQKSKNDDSIYTDLFRRISSIDFIIPVIGLGLLAMSASILDYIRRAKRKGFYELTEGTPETV